MQLNPIFIADSRLSSARTQHFIPACINVVIVSGTPSWISSSIAAIPMISKSFSILVATSSNLSYLFIIALEAFL